MIKILNILDVEKHLEDITGVVFDMDDTLYSEKHYVASGYKKIAEYLNKPNAAQELWEYFEAGKPAIDEYLKRVGKTELKEKCLDVYRTQIPDIKLYDGVKEMLARLKNSNKKLGIITDGRVEGQKNKILSLGLDKLVDDIIITDELGGIEYRKPNDTAFKIMQSRWQIPFEDMVYIGDNIKKDFIAPEKLGMKYIYFFNSDGLYSNI